MGFHFLDFGRFILANPLIDELDKVSTLAKDVTAVYLVAKVTFALQGQDGGETSWQTTPTYFTDYHGRKNKNVILQSKL